MNKNLEEIRDALLTVDDNVYYGAAGQVNQWNYTVFQRLGILGLDNKFAKTVKYRTAVVRENFIEEGVDEEVISALKGLPGVKISSDDVQFEYTLRPGTDTVVEIMMINFTRAESRQ